MYICIDYAHLIHIALEKELQPTVCQLAHTHTHTSPPLYVYVKYARTDTRAYY